jgi:DHA3 family macrolide efflux protein-like MFS transporter
VLVAVVLAVVLGLLVGGRLENLSRIRFQWGVLLFLAVVLRYGTETAIRNGFAPVEELRLPLYALAFAMVAAILWANRGQPGLLVAAAGVTANGVAIVLNGGWMPVWRPALLLVGMTPQDLVVSFHRLLPEQLGLEFLLRGGPFGDLIPVPIPFLTNVASIGDAFIAAGLAWYVFATLASPAAPAQGEALEEAPGGGTIPAPATGGRTSTLPHGIAAAAAIARRPLRHPLHGPELAPRAGVGTTTVLRRPVLLGGSTGGVGIATELPAGTAMEPPVGGAAGISVSAPGAGLAAGLRDMAPGAGVSTAGVPPQGLIAQASAAEASVSRGSIGRVTYPVLAPPITIPRGIRVRAAGHPYVRLALDARFSALWMGQTISLLGDRLNQIALAVLVLSITGSALDVGLTFLAATLPNLLFGPFAGTFVDRWNQKHVMVVSDLLRAGLVLLVPLAADRSVVLVYPAVFAVTTVSIFFRPARSAVIPRIVATDDLTAANSAMYTAETIADLAGYPLAGLFVAFLGSALTLAFWFDAASYVISALLLLSITVPPVVRSAAPVVLGSARRFATEMLDGWRFLRSEASLFQNTVISGIAQLATGAIIALTVVYARDVLQGTAIPYPQSYAAIDLVIGVGNLVGGLAIGMFGTRWRKGHLVIAGYVVLGLSTALLGTTGNEFVAFACVGVAGIANMVFIIPTQTLFAERTPQDLMGRVVGIRFSMVLGPLTLAMAISGILAQAVGVSAVFLVFGLLTAAAGTAGLLLPAVRDA